MMTAPLAGLRVLDLTTGASGPYATKLLADYGADVIKVEPPGGDPARGDGPFFNGVPHPEGSGRFLFLNTNKRNVVLDAADDADRETLGRLVGWSDAVFEDLPPGRLNTLGFGYAALEALRPGVVLVSITPFGQDGPYRDYRLTEIVAQAMGGPMLWTGSAQREPLRLGGAGAVALYQAGAVAALAAMTSLFRQQETGEGDHVDVSIYETQVASRDRAQPYLLNHIYNGMEPRRQLRGSALASGMRPCRDGYVNISAVGPRRSAFLRMIGRPDLVGPGLAERWTSDPAFHEEVERAYLAWLMQHTKAEAAATAQSQQIIAAPVNAIADLVADPHFRERGVWETVEHPHTGPVEYPGRPFVMPASPRPPARRAPLLDEHAAELRALRPPRRAPVTRSTGALPLAGVRVADITAVWAGPHVTQMLAEWGAEVIRVEPIARFQPSTRWAERQSGREEEERRARLGIGTGGGYPDFEPGERRWDRNSAFNSHARNKLSMTCDVMTEDGRARFLQLIATCDVFVENNVPDTIDKAGIGYEALRAVRPDIIVLRMPGFGLSGPYRGWRAFGTHVESLIGHHHVRGYPDGTPDEGGEVYTADAVAGVQGALAVLFALFHRRRTGEGQQVELAQAENFLPMLSEIILDWTMNGHDAGPWGNRHRSHAPHNVYPCAAPDGREQPADRGSGSSAPAGFADPAKRGRGGSAPAGVADRGSGQSPERASQTLDDWIAIEAESDADFAAICKALDLPELASDPRFAEAAARYRSQKELDALIAARTRERDKFELFQALQAAGVPAGPLQTAEERLRCRQLVARGFFEELENEAVGKHLNPGLTWKQAQTPNHLRRPPCTLGQDNGYVYRDLLGMPAAEYDRLCADGTIGTCYRPEAFAALHD